VGDKTCARCGVTKPLDEFFFRDRQRLRPQVWCKVCTNSYKRGWYQQNRERHTRISDAAKRRRITANLRQLRDYLTSHPCVDCGECDPVVLEFDHVRGDKVANVSKMVRDRPWSAILQELEKCEVRCANCHRRRTARQFGWHTGR
jgi:hypothetical protein